MTEVDENPEVKEMEELYQQAHQDSKSVAQHDGPEYIFYYREARDPQEMECKFCKTRMTPRVSRKVESSQFWFAFWMTLVCFCWCPLINCEAYIYNHHCTNCDKIVRTYDPIICQNFTKDHEKGLQMNAAKPSY